MSISAFMAAPRPQEEHVNGLDRLSGCATWYISPDRPHGVTHARNKARVVSHTRTFGHVGLQSCKEARTHFSSIRECLFQARVVVKNAIKSGPDRTRGFSSPRFPSRFSKNSARVSVLPWYRGRPSGPTKPLPPRLEHHEKCLWQLVDTIKPNPNFASRRTRAEAETQAIARS